MGIGDGLFVNAVERLLPDLLRKPTLNGSKDGSSKGLAVSLLCVTDVSAGDDDSHRLSE
jgi:hypothetical protein